MTVKRYDTESHGITVRFPDHGTTVISVADGTVIYEIVLDQADMLTFLQGMKKRAKEQVDELHQKLNYTVRTSYPRSKWDILYERGHFTEMLGLECTRCSNIADGGHIKCGYCGTEHNTEGDFARHYIVTDSRYLNLGECPHDPKVQV